MTFRIHFTLPDGSTDSVVISADSIVEIHDKALEEIANRNASEGWSEELTK